MRNTRMKQFSCVCLMVLFGLMLATTSAFAWNPYFTAYYGTSNTSDYNTAAANWVGGDVYRVGQNNHQLGTSSYKESQAWSTGDQTIRINPDSGYKIVSVKWCVATWSSGDADNIISTGSWNTVSGLAATQTSDFSFDIPNTQANTKYLIWVVFAQVGATGGQVGAWYGTNNTSGYNTPAANGSGGQVWKTSGNDSQLSNGVANGYDTNSNATRTFQVRPASGFRIVSIDYGVSLSPATWNSVTVSASQTTNVSFDISISDGNQYVIWVVFASTATSSFTVSGTVDPTTDASCGTSTISPTSQIVNINQSGTFTFGTGSNCQVESVNFNNLGPQAWVGTGFTYTTPAITATSTFVVKFRPIGYTINASVDSSSPSGCGSISPAGAAVAVAQAGSQTFTITVNSGCSISHVYVTDTNHSYTNFDVSPLSNNTYTFSNVQANGVITVSFVSSVPASGNDYCQVPPFVQGQTSLTPNVLIIFDNSGSMGGTDTDGYAYYNRTGKTYDCTATNNATTSLCPTIYYGYFDPYKMYKTDTSNANVYLIDNVTLNMSSTNGKSGNYLNYRNMNKVDVIRKILVGGRVTDKGSSTLAGTNRATLTTKYLKTDNGKWVEYGSSEPTGLVQNLANRVRFGLEVFGSTTNTSSDGGKIIAKLGSPVGDLVSAIEGSATNPTTSTPIAEALYESVRYYQAKPSAYNSSTNYGDTTWNPTANPIIQYACQKNFVLLLTDGEANNNDKLPGLTGNPTLNSYTDTVFSVTTWRDRMLTADLPTTSDGKYVDAVAYYAHNTDLRSSAYSNDMAGTQNLTFYAVYAFGDGTGTKTLQMMSKYGGYESKNGNDKGTAPTLYASPDLASEWDKDSNSIPDTYFEGDDGAVLENNIMSALSSILAKVASGTAASILSNSEGTGANLLQAVFYPNKIFENSTEVNWIGEMQNMWYYVDPFIVASTVREDTDFSTTTPYHIMNLKNDYAARFYFNGTETLAELKQDTDGDGTGDLVINTTANPDSVKSIWRAGRLLRERTAESRTIHTTVDGVSLLSPTSTGGGFYAASVTSSGTSTASRVTALQPYLQAANNDTNAEAVKIINFIRGADQTNYRTRKVSLLSTDTPADWKEWKLGDIISSTPRLQSSQKLNIYNLDYPIGYGDKSYNTFVNTANYKNRGMVYVGANDGMLHAFKLGKLTVSGTTDVPGSTVGTYLSISGNIKATLTGNNLGEEQWAFIPRNTLPYLKYMTDRDNYKHLYYVDGPTVLTDVAIGRPATCASSDDYSSCVKDESGGTNWRTVLISSMGLGGASKIKDTTVCTSGANGTCVKTPILDPADTTKGVGYSSYFALDITGQYFDSNGALANQPSLKWEFAHPELGYATSGAAVVRISAKKAGTDAYGNPTLVTDITKNGKWFAVFASGPTGPIDSDLHQFKGKSDQNLKLFVVDLGATAPLVLNQSYWVIDTQIKRAFGGNMVNASIDTDRWNRVADGNFQDDAIYFGYTKANIADTTAITSTTEWTNGGVLRLLTKEDLNPANWVVSPVISDIGSVTSGVAKLQDRKNKKLWLYFGSGRFYFGGDDPANQRYIVGVQEGCYTPSNAIDKNCVTASPGVGGVLAIGNLKQQDTIGSLGLTDKGWYISLAGQDTTNNLGAERNITDPVAQSNGVVCYTTFMPTSDVCKFGGDSYLWCTKYDTGGTVPAAGLSAKALVQVSTGSFEEIPLSTALTAEENRKMGTPMTGKPPADPPPIISNSGNKPPKRILHLQEK